MNPCRSCGKDFDPTPHQVKKSDWLCRPCQRVYWHSREHKSHGRHGVEDPAKKRAYMLLYVRRPAVKQRKAEQMRRYRADPRLVERVLARAIVKNRLRNGTMHRGPCEVCSEPEGQAHHDDYARPVDVRWLCPLHHREQHKAAKDT